MQAAVGSWEEIVWDDQFDQFYFWEDDFMDVPKFLPILPKEHGAHLVHAEKRLGFALPNVGAAFILCQVTDGSGRLGNNLAFILRSWAANNLNRLGSGMIRYTRIA